MSRLVRRAAECLAAMLLTGALLLHAPLHAADFPEKSITLLIPVPPGGSSSIVAAVLAPALSRALKVPVEVRNISAGSALNGTHEAAGAKPDGYTLVLSASTIFLTAPEPRPTPQAVAAAQALTIGRAFSPVQGMATQNLAALQDIAAAQRLTMRQSFTPGGTVSPQPPPEVQTPPGAQALPGTQTPPGTQFPPAGQASPDRQALPAPEPAQPEPAQPDPPALDPLVLATRAPRILAVHPSLGVRSLHQLIDHMHAQPGQLVFGSSGPGSPNQVLTHYFCKLTNSTVQDAFFTGGGPMMPALLSGKVQAAFQDVAVMGPAVKRGDLVILASTGRQRSRQLPDTPTFAELGLPQLEAYLWQVVSVPRGVPAPVRQTLEQAVRTALMEPTVMSPLEDLGFEVVASGSAQSRRILAEERQLWMARDAEPSPISSLDTTR